MASTVGDPAEAIGGVPSAALARAERDRPGKRPGRPASWLDGWTLTARAPRLLAATAAFFTVLAVSLYRAEVARGAKYPGHADPAFFYNVAQNLHAGRGAQIDYVWHFLVPGTPLRHYAFDYWLPLPSVLMSFGLGVGHDLPAAVDVSVVMAAVMSASTYALTRAFTTSFWAPAVAAVAIVAQPVVSMFAVQTESAVYLGAFGLTAMAAAVHARRRLPLWVVAGAAAALANMSRSEGLILMAVLGVAALAWAERSRWQVRLGLLLLGYLPVAAPYFYENLSHFGAVLPPAATSFPFITQNEDLFSPHINRSLSGLFGTGIVQFVNLRFVALVHEVRVAFSAFTRTDAVVLVILAALLISRRSPRRAPMGQRVLGALRSSWFVPVGFVVALFLFDALVAPVVAGAGATVKGMVTVAAVPIVAVLVALAGSGFRQSITVVSCALLVLSPIAALPRISKAVVRHNNGFGQAASNLGPALKREQKCLDRPVVMMTRHPWEFTQATGVPSVQIPAGSVADVVAVAREYGVTDIEDPQIRPQLSDLSAMLAATGPLTLAEHFGSRRIYRIRATTAGHAHC